MSKVCEVGVHKRIEWGMLALFLLGVGCGAYVFGGDAPVMILAAVMGTFCLGVWSGFIKLESPKPKKKPEEGPKEGT